MRKSNLFVIVSIFILMLFLCSCGGDKADANSSQAKSSDGSYTLTVNGESSVTVDVFGKYEDKGATVKSSSGKQSKVNGTGVLNTAKVGEYTIKYVYKHNKNTLTAVRNIKVVDKTAPTIKLNGASEVTASSRELYKESGTKAVDNYDGDITGNVWVTEKREGNDYIFIYKVEDSSGNSAQTTRRVHIKDIVAPVIKLSGGREVYVPLGGSYSEPGVTASDDLDGDLTSKIKSSGSVDTSKSGPYTITYTVSDKAGNSSTVKRTVRVYANQSDNPNRVYLTFDDGPSNVTTRILDTLAQYNVKATFFIINYNDSKKPIIQRMINEGHTVALHSYNHQYSNYTSVETYMNDLHKLHDKVLADFGYDAKIMRFPGGSSNAVSKKYCTGIMSKLVEIVEGEGYTYFDWNVSSGDAEGNGIASQKLINNVVKGLRPNRNNVVLMHDTGAKSTTADALPEILNQCIANGYAILPITSDTLPVHHRVQN